MCSPAEPSWQRGPGHPAAQPPSCWHIHVELPESVEAGERCDFHVCTDSCYGTWSCLNPWRQESRVDCKGCMLWCSEVFPFRRSSCPRRDNLQAKLAGCRSGRQLTLSKMLLFLSQSVARASTLSRAVGEGGLARTSSLPGPSCRPAPQACCTGPCRPSWSCRTGSTGFQAPRWALWHPWSWSRQSAPGWSSARSSRVRGLCSLSGFALVPWD